MSNPGALNPFASLVVTGNPTVDSVIRYGLVAILAALSGIIGGWLNAHGFHDPNINLLVSGALISILSAGALALWGILRTKNIAKITDTDKLIAMNATLALVHSGNAIDTSGNVIAIPIDDSTPPKPITAQTMPEIVKTFGPVASSITKI